MVGFDASESLTPFREGSGYGAILFDRKHLRQADPDWFDPDKWGERARPVDSGGRGSAWFIEAPSSQCVLRHYRRGGFAARFSQDRYLWHGPDRTRSFAEFRLTRALLARGHRPEVAVFTEPAWARTSPCGWSRAWKPPIWTRWPCRCW